VIASIRKSILEKPKRIAITIIRHFFLALLMKPDQELYQGFITHFKIEARSGDCSWPTFSEEFFDCNDVEHNFLKQKIPELIQTIVFEKMKCSRKKYKPEQVTKMQLKEIQDKGLVEFGLNRFHHLVWNGRPSGHKEADVQEKSSKRIAAANSVSVQIGDLPEERQACIYS
jgi:hypothetical protein